MSLTLLLGGVRSGKSALAVRWATEWNGPVTVLATAQARDDEMAERIKRHRQERPSHWSTVEEPLELERRVAGVDASAFVIIDCLTLWLSNLIDNGLDNEQIEERSGKAAALAATRSAPTIAITNEVGFGIIPANALARRFGEVLGKVNMSWADAAETTYVMFAGKVMRL